MSVTDTFSKPFQRKQPAFVDRCCRLMQTRSETNIHAVVHIYFSTTPYTAKCPGDKILIGHGVLIMIQKQQDIGLAEKEKENLWL